MNIINDGVYNKIFIGSFESALSRDLLMQNNIKFVLNVTQYYNNNKYKNINYYQVCLLDELSEDLLYSFNKTIPYLEYALENNGNILVHCRSGISRSSSTVIGFLMYKLNLTYEESLNLVRKSRSIICPNKYFEKQLLFLQLYLKNPSTYKLTDYMYKLIENSQNKIKGMLYGQFVGNILVNSQISEQMLCLYFCIDRKKLYSQYYVKKLISNGLIDGKYFNSNTSFQEWKRSGHSCGSNSVVSRSTILGILNDIDNVIMQTDEVCKITNWDLESRINCVFVSVMIHFLISNSEDVINKTINTLYSYLQLIINGYRREFDSVDKHIYFNNIWANFIKATNDCDIKEIIFAPVVLSIQTFKNSSKPFKTLIEDIIKLGGDGDDIGNNASICGAIYYAINGFDDSILNFLTAQQLNYFKLIIHKT